MKDNYETSYGYFEDVNENDVILNYSSENLPNYGSGCLISNTDFIKKKKDSYDATYNTSEEEIKYIWHDYMRKCRIYTILFFQCAWPFIIVGCIVALAGWIAYQS